MKPTCLVYEHKHSSFFFLFPCSSIYEFKNFTSQPWLGRLFLKVCHYDLMDFISVVTE